MAKPSKIVAAMGTIMALTTVGFMRSLIISRGIRKTVVASRSAPLAV
jgi:hypothetical protein